MIHFFQPDWHSPTHLFGSFFLVRLIFKTSGSNIDKAAIWAFVIGIAWEILEESFKGRWVFDPRGYDVMDIIVNGLGCMLAVVLR